MKIPDKTAKFYFACTLLAFFCLPFFSFAQSPDSTRHFNNIVKISATGPITGNYEMGYERIWKSGRWSVQGNAGLQDASSLWHWRNGQGFLLESSMKWYLKNFHQQKRKIKSLLHGLYFGPLVRLYHLQGERKFFDPLMDISTSRFCKYDYFLSGISLGCQIRFLKVLFLDFFWGPAYIMQIKNKTSLFAESLFFQSDYFTAQGGIRLGIGF